MGNQFCFHCDQLITDDKWSGLRVRDAFYSFHRQCIREVVSRHIMEILDREKDLETRAAAKERRIKLANDLGFTARFDIQHVCHDPEMLGICSVCGQVPEHHLHISAEREAIQIEGTCSAFSSYDDTHRKDYCSRCGSHISLHQIER